MNQYRQFEVGAILGKKKGSVLVGVVDCAAFACYSVVQGEAVHGEVVCVACLVLKNDSALNEFVDAAADGAFVHQEHFAGCLAIHQEAVVLSDEGSVSSSVSGAGPSVKHYFRIIFRYTNL